jgi:hypothetical protein
MIDILTDTMADTSDDTQILSATRLCELVDVARPRRSGWADLDLLSKRHRYGELDVVESVIFTTLVKELEYEDAVLAWRQIRSDVSAANWDNELIVVFDNQRKSAVLVHEPAATGDHVLHGRLVRVLDLSEVVAGARTTFQRILEESRRAKKAAK